MRELIIGVLLALSVGCSYAAPREKTAEPSEPTAIQIIDRIDQIAEKAAKGVVTFAKELGVAADQFINTPTGKIVLVAGGLYLFGGALKGFLLGCILLFIVFPACAIAFVKGQKGIPRHEYETTEVFGIKRRTIANTQYVGMDDGWVFRQAVLLAFTVFSFIVGMAII